MAFDGSVSRFQIAGGVDIASGIVVATARRVVVFDATYSGVAPHDGAEMESSAALGLAAHFDAEIEPSESYCGDFEDPSSSSFASYFPPGKCCNR